MKKLKFKIQKRRRSGDNRIIYDVYIRRGFKWVNISTGKSFDLFTSAEEFISVYIKNKIHITIVDDKSL